MEFSENPFLPWSYGFVCHVYVPDREDILFWVGEWVGGYLCQSSLGEGAMYVKVVNKESYEKSWMLFHG